MAQCIIHTRGNAPRQQAWGWHGEAGQMGAVEGMGLGFKV